MIGGTVVIYFVSGQAHSFEVAATIMILLGPFLPVLIVAFMSRMHR